MPPAQRALERLPERYAVAILDLLPTIATNSRRLGKPLHSEWQGCWVSRRGPYRVIYLIDESVSTVRVFAVAHRADIYRQR
jgi:mRNA-degrading endonuclease RelE of RelBE toxin-antitoxin system